MKINDCPARITIQWVPGHSNIPGNELADKEAKRATEEEGPGRAISIQGIKQVVNAVIKDEAISHERTRAVYACKSSAKEKLVTERNEQVGLARLRTGHHPGFKTYQHRLNDEEDPSCPRCKDTPGLMQPYCLDNVEHWLECDATAEARMRTFGRVNVGLEILTDDPRGSVALARSTLRGAGWEGFLIRP